MFLVGATVIIQQENRSILKDGLYIVPPLIKKYFFEGIENLT